MPKHISRPLRSLRRSISTDLAERASDEGRVTLAREASRRTIAEFVEGWLLAHEDWESGVFSAVKVYFAGEMDDALRRELRDAPAAQPAAQPAGR